MRFLKTFLILCVIAFIVYILYRAGFLQREKLEKEAVITVEHVKDILKLATQDIFISQDIEYRKEKKSGLFTYHFDVIALVRAHVIVGFDADRTEIKINDILRQIEISLPEPEVISVDITDYKPIEIREPKFGFKAEKLLTRREQFLYAREAIKNVVDSLLYNTDLYDKSIKQAKNFFKIFEQLTGYKVKVKIIKEKLP